MNNLVIVVLTLIMFVSAVNKDAFYLFASGIAYLAFIMPILVRMTIKGFREDA